MTYSVLWSPVQFFDVSCTAELPPLPSNSGTSNSGCVRSIAARVSSGDEAMCASWAILFASVPKMRRSAFFWRALNHELRCAQNL